MTREQLKKVQARLLALGYGPLAVDGIMGRDTKFNIIRFQYKEGLDMDGVVGTNTWNKLFPPPPVINVPKPQGGGRFMTTKEIVARYGQPGPANLVSIHLPYPMTLAWDKSIEVTKISCHKSIANSLLAVFYELLNTYGLAEIRRLGIDLYGGCYNYRKMTGGSEWSRHAWGIAIDLDPSNNQYKWGRDKARFARAEYKPMMEIFYKHGFINLGVERNFDYMHFEISLQ